MRGGGQSLNLTEANRVILVDPWWNDTAEAQAFGRVNRRGQQKSPHFVRILTKNSLDERISNMQESKAFEISHTLQDDGHQPKPMSEAELDLAFVQDENDPDKKPVARRKFRPVRSCH